MRQETSEVIAQLESVAWCENCGHEFAPRADWSPVLSFAEARKNSLSDDWLKFRLMISNRMHRAVSQVDYDRFSRWNSISDEVQRSVATLIERATTAWIKNGEPSMRDRISIAWDIQGICVETEYSDLIPPLFFLPRIFECYKKGHRPCGWIGQQIDEKWAGTSTTLVPNGKLLVF